MGVFDIFKKANPLKEKINLIEKEIKKTISIFCQYNFSVVKYGAYEIDAKYLVFWICVDTDSIKKELESNQDLKNQLRNILFKYEYPKNAINSVFIGFESQETVNRESQGDWYLHFK
jgi:hypothetical protein